MSRYWFVFITPPPYNHVRGRRGIRGGHRPSPAQHVGAGRRGHEVNPDRGVGGGSAEAGPAPGIRADS